MKAKKLFIGVLACSMIASLAACGPSEDEAKVTATLSSEDQSTVMDAASVLDEMTLENKTIKWCCYWDINPAADAETIPTQYVMFTEKFGGNIEYIQTTWDGHATQLANLILGGNSPDFTQAYPETFPTGAVTGMYQPVDDYIDFDADLWKDVKELNDKFAIGDKHYAIATAATEGGYVCIYNRNTIEEYGFDDPAELFYQNAWTWDVFEDMCVEFTNPEEERYAIDGWFFEDALMGSAGVPITEIVDGKVVCNINDVRLEKVANFMYDLAKNGVVYPRWAYGWVVLENAGIESGQTLFWPVGAYAVDPDSDGQMFVPMPRNPDDETYYSRTGFAGVHICVGAPNPEGVAIYQSCDRIAYMSDEVKQIGYDQRREQGWTEEMIDMFIRINEISTENIVIDVTGGITSEYATLADQARRGTMEEPQSTWAELKAQCADGLLEMIDQYNDQLAALG